MIELKKNDAPADEPKTGLLAPRTTYKPFAYPWAYEAFLQSEQMHWLWTEVPMMED